VTDLSESAPLLYALGVASEDQVANGQEPQLPFQVVRSAWVSDCLQAQALVPVEPRHMVPFVVKRPRAGEEEEEEEGEEDGKVRASPGKRPRTGGFGACVTPPTHTRT
jgi:hypothetical protein